MMLTLLLVPTSTVLGEGGTSSSDDPPTGSTFVAEIPSKSPPPAKTGDEDIEKVVDLIFKHQIDVEQLAKFMAKLDKYQYETMRQLFSERVGIVIEPVNVDNASVMGPLAVASWTYVETIENVWTWNYNPKIFASSSYRDDNCDADEHDVDYAFYYPVSTSPSTQGNLRWTTTNPQVYAAFQIAYGGNLSAFAYSWNEVRLCTGSRGTALAGGTSAIANSVFVHY